jgi:integrase
VRTRRPIQDVRIFDVQYRKPTAKNKRPRIVRWSIDGRQRSKAFHTKAEADRYRSQLINAQHAGETFDPETGEPTSWLPAPDDLQLHVWARQWLAEQWHEWQPRTRTSAVEALSRFLPLASVPRATPAPKELRGYLVRSLPPGGPVDDDDACEKWLSRCSLALSSLNRELLADVERRLALGDAGQPLSAWTAGRYRKVARSCIRRAVELEVLDSDPWPPAPRGRSRRKVSRQRRVVDVRRLPDPATMVKTIAAVQTHQPGSRKYRVMTAISYYGGLRPSEVVMLRPRALQLPEEGWGRIDVVEADIDWDEPGEPKMGERSVPMPPQLVAILRAWVGELSPGPDDLLFRTRNDNRPSPSNWARALKRALAAVGHPPIRVYDCRHAAATTWLAAGVPLGEAARRLGHSVETLVSTYVGALQGDEDLANERIEAALRAAASKSKDTSSAA